MNHFQSPFWFSLLFLLASLLMNEAALSQAQTVQHSIPSLRESDQRFEDINTYQIALGDLDSDGDLDAVFANMRFNHSQVWLNDGMGRFRDSGQQLTQQGHGVDLGDLDGDGDVDIFMTCAGYGYDGVDYHKPSKVYFNDGHAVFTDSGQDLGDTDLSGNDVALIDVDTDGDLDAIVAYYQAPDRIYLNNGRGAFSYTDQNAPEDATWGDLDGDGDEDIFAKERGVGYRIWFNDGIGRFALHWSQPDSAAAFGAVALGDLDLDGDIDAVVANGDRSATHSTKVFLNDGTGRFSDSGQVLPKTTFGRLALGDLNGDNALDVLIASREVPPEVWFNDGRGHFYDSGLRLTSSVLSGHSALGDLDGDGDTDVFEATFVDGPNMIWFNEGEQYED